MSIDIHDRLDEEIREFQAAQTWVWPIRPDPRLQELFVVEQRQVCPVCGRTTRPWNAPAADYPGTVRGLVDGRCKDGCPPLQPRKQMRVGQPCGSCGRPMRPQKMRRDKAPGTVLHAANGLCNTCRKEQQRKAAA